MAVGQRRAAAFTGSRRLAVSAVGQSGWTHGLCPEASTGTVGGGFCGAGTGVTGIQRELTVGVAGRQQAVGADREGADPRPLQPEAGQQAQGDRHEGG